MQKGSTQDNSQGNSTQGNSMHGNTAQGNFSNDNPVQDNPVAHICQNCGADLHDKYCARCGQKSTAAFDRSVISLAQHFFEELFVWD